MNLTTLNISDSDYFCTWVTTHDLHCLANQSEHARGRGLWSRLAREAPVQEHFPDSPEIGEGLVIRTHRD